MLARARVCACESEGGREREMLNQLMCVCGVLGGDVGGRGGGTDALFIPHCAWMCVLTGYPA